MTNMEVCMNEQEIDGIKAAKAVEQDNVIYGRGRCVCCIGMGKCVWN